MSSPVYILTYFYPDFTDITDSMGSLYREPPAWRRRADFACIDPGIPESLRIIHSITPQLKLRMIFVPTL
jgi:hypothetical protein